MNFSQHDETAAAAINEHPELFIPVDSQNELFIQIDSPIDFDIQDENSVQNQTDSQRDYADLYSHDSTFPGVLTQLLQGSDTLELYKNWEDPEPTTTSQSIRGYSPAASQSSRGQPRASRVMPENGSSGSSKERDSSDSSNDSETDSFRERDSSDSSNDSGTDSFREHPVGRKVDNNVQQRSHQTFNKLQGLFQVSGSTPSGNPYLSQKVLSTSAPAELVCAPKAVLEL
ncbi:dentin sialophosphoprotein-like, partial [Polypterus senegalus]|uniref:dentin sialophosphoprotein-like n=1 Tax=Polypterus senegalus TaxID=55291 RepID=UPI001962B12E